MAKLSNNQPPVPFDASLLKKAVVSRNKKLSEYNKSLEAKIKELILGHEAQMQKEVTDRWKVDMQSDSWLSKNIRPLVLIFLVVSTILIIFIDAGTISFEVKSSWVDLLQLVLITVIGAYFGGRSLEKVKK